MAACRRLCFSSVAQKQLFLRYYFPKLYSTELASSKVNEGEKEIVIPPRIKRGPTDILKALATTINRDYTAAHYKYHDDPYLIPVSNASKRAFALSKESGKKAAHYFLEKYPEFFKCHTSVPHVQAFDPPVTYAEEDDLDEKTLESCVRSHDLSNSITVYQILKKKGIPVSQETKQKLLELVCFYNEIPPVNEDYSEERWFSLSKGRPKRTWKTKGVAEQLFDDLEKDSAAYCAMIQGTAKYYDSTKAFELYEEMRSNNLPANLEIYNSLLTLVPFVKESGDSRWEFAMELVSNMNKEGLFPNLYTMNALLGLIATNNRWDKGKSIAAQILAEMKRLDIEPSLGSYYHILTVFLHSDYLPSVFTDIIGKVDGKDFEIWHPDDLLFFVAAMEMCYKYLKNVDLGYRINALLEKGQNSVLIGSSLNESIFYRYLFKLLCENEDFEKFMEFYNKYVPGVYTPEPSIIHEMILMVELYGAYHHLPQIGSDLMMFEHSDRETLLFEFLRVAGSVKQAKEIQKPLVDISWRLKDLIDGRQSRMLRKAIQWSGTALGNVIKILLNGEELEKAKLVLLQLKKEEASIIGYPEKDVLVQFCSVFLEAKDFAAVKICVKYAVDSCCPDIGNDLSKVVEDLYKSEKLSDAERSAVMAIIETSVNEDNISDEKNESYNENVSSSS